MNDYAEFLARKSQANTMDGFTPYPMPSFLMDFQSHMVDWGVRMGRCAWFEDCGMGKTIQQIVWADQIVRHTNGRAIIWCPLAVAEQTIREGSKFGIEVRLAVPGQIGPAGIYVANYEKIHLFDASDFVAAVCDESACLKNFKGVRRQQITDFMRKMRYRLLCTATPSPNEFIELGTSSEALGYLGYMDMLSRFFKNDQGNSIKASTYRHKGKSFSQLDDNAKWRFKGHAEQPFWRWVCSWARAIRKPSDLGFDDDKFILPPMIERQHLVEARSRPDGMLFALPAVGLDEQRDERRRTVTERCEKAAALVYGTGQPAIIWCHLNDEGDMIERMVPDCVQVSGADSDDAKVEKFMSFIDGRARVLVTKEKIAGWGLNFQHCAHIVGFPTHSFEGYYQRIRRCWRFGQSRQVVSDMVTTEGERDVLSNLQRKAVQADRMFAGLVAHMNNSVSIDRGINFTKKEEWPEWL